MCVVRSNQSLLLGVLTRASTVTDITVVHYIITNNIGSLTGGRAEEVVGVTGCEGQLKRGLRKIITPTRQIIRAQTFGNMKYYRYIPVDIYSCVCVYRGYLPRRQLWCYSTIEGGRQRLPVDPENNSAKWNLSSRVLRVISFGFCCINSESPHRATSWIAHLNKEPFTPSNCLVVPLGDVDSTHAFPRHEGQ